MTAIHKLENQAIWSTCWVTPRTRLEGSINPSQEVLNEFSTSDIRALSDIKVLVGNVLLEDLHPSRKAIENVCRLI